MGATLLTLSAFSVGVGSEPAFCPPGYWNPGILPGLPLSTSLEGGVADDGRDIVTVEAGALVAAESVDGGSAVATGVLDPTKPNEGVVALREAEALLVGVALALSLGWSWLPPGQANPAIGCWTLGPVGAGAILPGA